MRSEELVGALDGLPGVEVSVNGDGTVTVDVPAIGDSARLDPADVLNCSHVASPTGAPAVHLGVRRGHEQLPLVVTVGDVVFMPSYAADMLVSGADVRVPGAPDMVAYSEMHRDVRALGRALDEPEAEFDPEMLAATLLVHRCFLAGAMRVGLWPVRVAAWWEYAWARVGAQLPLGEFRADPAFDRLLADVAAARQGAGT
ncbi:hypothetical protein [Spirilliplanes yamanashiensis]|nr:hypothetical protein [Spirilliplanes yamanashiensis]MDP9819383.1 hypothetical protein [Spirilliplanes yamanashiensis]